MIVKLSKYEVKTLASLDPKGSGGGRPWQTARQVGSVLFKRKEEKLSQEEVRVVRNAFRKLIREGLVEMGGTERGKYRVSEMGKKSCESGKTEFEGKFNRGEATKAAKAAGQIRAKERSQKSVTSSVKKKVAKATPKKAAKAPAKKIAEITKKAEPKKSLKKVVKKAVKKISAKPTKVARKPAKKLVSKKTSPKVVVRSTKKDVPVDALSDESKAIMALVDAQAPKRTFSRTEVKVEDRTEEHQTDTSNGANGTPERRKPVFKHRKVLQMLNNKN